MPEVWDQQSAFGRMLTDRRQAFMASCLLMLAADNSIYGLDAVGRHRDPVPRDPGLGLREYLAGLRVKRARDQTGEMENHHPVDRDGF